MDQQLREELASHLANLRNQQFISDWYEGDISPGTEWLPQIMSHLAHDQLILLLISSDFMASQFCYSIELEQAISRHNKEEARVLPILLRPVDYKGAPFAKLQPLPSNRVPVTQWLSHDEAFVDVVNGIRKAIDELQASTAFNVVIEELQPIQPVPLDQLSIADLIPMRNQYFTGRDSLLKVLHNKLTAERTGENMPVAITGLGGIGKTQLAIEYIHRYRNEYSYVLWAKADTPETLISELFKLAKKLDAQLTEKDEQNPPLVTAHVRQWLEQNLKWLLVLDNVNPHIMNQDTSKVGYPIDNILKELPHNGHILLTTRSDTLGALAESVHVEVMDTEDGAKFLLRRLTLLERDDGLTKADSHDLHNAKVLVEMLGGLPLALEQAAAYIQETKCGIGKYYEHYQSEGKRLRNRRGRFLTGTQSTVATTWSLSFQDVEQTSPVAAELLRALSYLAPGTIPEEIINEGASELGDILGTMSSLDFDEAIGVLLRYSLVQRNERTQYLIIHQLVQNVLKDDMHDDKQRIWAERIVRAVNSVFPDGSIATWQRCENCQQNGKTCPIKDACSSKRLTRCQRYLPHAQVCVQYIEQYEFMFPEAAQLLHHTASYLHSYAALYSNAESYYYLALKIREKQSEGIALEIAANHNDLARLYRDQYQYEEATRHFEEAIRIREEKLGPRDPITAISKRSLARLHLVLGQYDKAEELFVSALRIHQYNQSKDNTATVAREVANSSYGLARLYHLEGRYEKAQALYEQALKMDSDQFGQDHLFTAQCLNSLGALYRDRRDFKKAEELMLQALTIRQKVLETTTLGDKQELRHPDTAQSLNDLGGLYRSQNRYKEAEELIQQALTIRRAVLRWPNGPDCHPDIAQSLSNLAGLYSSQKRYDKAEPLYLQAFEINVKTLGHNHPYTAHTLSSLAELYFNQGRYDEAEECTKQAFAIRIRIGGPSPMDVAQSLYNIARMHYARGHNELAELFYQYTLALDKHELGLADPRTVMVMERYAALLHKMSRNVDAAALEARIGQG